MRTMLTVVLFCSFAGAADIKLHSVDPAPPATPGGPITKLYVQFETPVPLTDAQVQCSPGGATLCASVWEVALHDSSGTLSITGVTSAVPGRHLPSRGLVTLTVDPIAPGFSRVDVTFKRGKNPHITLEPTVRPTKTLIKPANTCDDADVCISGSVTPAVGAGPTYNIDSKAKYIFHAFGETGATTIAASADIKTDNRSSADPDSFHWGLPLQYVSTKPYTWQWSIVGMDFDKKGQAMNLVSAPNVTWIGNHIFTKPSTIANVTSVLASVGLDLTAGVEIGDNFRNDYAVVNKNNRGEGGFFRGVPSATAYLIVPDILKLNKVAISSTYTVRILTRDELFLETRNTKDAIPKLMSGTRHYLENKIQFMLTEYIGFQIKHKYGELPPAFKFANHSVSIGLLFAFSQTKVP